MRRMRLRQIVVAGLLALICGPAIGAAEQAPGSIVAMTPPPGFVPARRFSGFQNPDIGGTILIAEMGLEAKGDMVGIFTSLETAKTPFARQGVELEERVEIDGASAPAFVYRGVQSANGVVYEKWVGLFIGDKVAIVSFQAPRGRAPSRAVIAQSFASVELGAPASLEQRIALLPYRFTDLGEFRIARILARTTAWLTIGPRDTDPDNDQPSMVIALSFAPIELPANLRAHGRIALSRIATLTDLKFLKGRETTVAGAPGYRLDASAIDISTGRPMRVAQWMRYDDDYVRIVAFAPAETWRASEPKFEAIVKNFRIAAAE